MKIGFIDYYLDEWHANNYPKLIKEASNGEMEVTYAYGMIDSPIGGITTDEWCEKFGIERCFKIEDIIEKSDAIIVLSPDNCEMHEELCQLPLRSKKCVYIDKTFAPDAKTALRIFKIADESGTPCYSTSALRFAEEYKEIDKRKVHALSTWGPGDINTYSIHQIEPIVMIMGTSAKRVMLIPSKDWNTLNIEFSDGRFATLTQFVKGVPFTSAVCIDGGNKSFEIKSDYFYGFIENLVEFFRTGIVPVSHNDTVTIMAIRAAAINAQQRPCEWVEVEN